jgi:hypothetical protein
MTSEVNCAVNVATGELQTDAPTNRSDANFDPALVFHDFLETYEQLTTDPYAVLKILFLQLRNSKSAE